MAGAVPGHFFLTLLLQSHKSIHQSFPDFSPIHSFNLETAVGRKKDPQGIGVHREREKVEVTLVVMRHFSVLRGAPRACADFCDPTAVSRFKLPGPLIVSP